MKDLFNLSDLKILLLVVGVLVWMNTQKTPDSIVVKPDDSFNQYLKNENERLRRKNSQLEADYEIQIKQYNETREEINAAVTANDIKKLDSINTKLQGYSRRQRQSHIN